MRQIQRDPVQIDRRGVLASIGGASLAALASPALAAKPSASEAAIPAKESLLLTYEPITQIRARTVNFYRPTQAGIVGSVAPPGPGAVGRRADYEWGELRQDEVKNLLSNYSQWVTAYKFSGSGDAKAPLVSGRLEKGNYRIVIDFLRYMTQTVLDGEGKVVLGRCVVGVGLRTVADVNNFTASGEASLISLAAKAQVNQADGKLRFDSIGIAADDVSALMPTNVSLDESGVVQASAAMAAIKGLMKDEKTILVPHVIAVQYENNTTEPVRAQLIDRVSRG